MGKIRVEDYLDEDEEYNFKSSKRKKEKHLSFSDDRWDYITY